MTEIAVRQDATVSIIQTAAADMDAAHRMATALVSTAFCPQHFKGKPDDATAAVLYGAEVGLSPLASLQNIYVISGRPAMYARTMSAVVMSHGHEMWTEESTAQKVVVCGRRKGSEHVERSEWTYDRARKAGYTTNKKYDTDPQSMLYARASGDVARHVAPDALLGMAYSVEELQEAPVGADGVPDIAAPRTGADRLREAIGSPPSAETPQEPVRATAERTDQGITRPQLTALNAALTGDLGLAERDDKLAFLSEELGRPIGSSQELTKAEASDLIDRIKRREVAAPPAAPPAAAAVVEPPADWVEEPPADWQPTEPDGTQAGAQ